MDPADIVPPLPANLRNTQQIHRFISCFYEGAGGVVARGPEGRPVLVLGYENTQELGELLAAQLRELVYGERMSPKDIVLLTPSRLDKSELRQHGGVPGFWFRDLQDLLNEREGQPTAHGPGGHENGNPGAVQLLASTVHKFKGLEAPIIILAEIGDRHREDFDRYLYVGGSRAKSHLVVLAKRPVDEEIRSRARLKNQSSSGTGLKSPPRDPAAPFS
jgi:ATP-dependent exoDNAse (exonuclease V) beta subunit